MSYRQLFGLSMKVCNRMYFVEKLFFTLAKVISQNTDLIKRATINDHLCGDSLVTLEILSDKVFTEFFNIHGRPLFCQAFNW
ncbi:MAG: hypothetical protein WC742_04845 [Gallionellaceae bacterium]|jgi:hypothetical protein